jgi:hypothetical protein
VFVDAHYPMRVVYMIEWFGARHIALRIDDIDTEKSRYKELCLAAVS